MRVYSHKWLYLRAEGSDMPTRCGLLLKQVPWHPKSQNLQVESCKDSFPFRCDVFIFIFKLSMSQCVHTSIEKPSTKCLFCEVKYLMAEDYAPKNKFTLNDIPSTIVKLFCWCIKSKRKPKTKAQDRSSILVSLGPHLAAAVAQ